MSKYPTKGVVNSLVILIDFPDRTFSGDIDQRKYFEDFLMKPGFNDLGSYGSVHDYFIDNSMGVFDPRFDVFGPITMKDSVAHYGSNGISGNDRHPHEMVLQACLQLDEEIDFSKYDNDQDGYIDEVHIIFAGAGENASKEEDDIWPHSGSVISAYKRVYWFDGIILDKYTCTSELYNGKKDGIGVFCHEFCHALGLHDVYKSNNPNHAYTDGGSYDLMDEGLYLTAPGSSLKEGRWPCALTAYERYELGWLEPEMLTANKYLDHIYWHRDTIPFDETFSDIVIRYDTIPEFAPDSLPCLPLSNMALLLPVESSTNDPRDGEYYLFENRQQTGWDTCIPGHGLLVWHIDFNAELWASNKINVDVAHPGIDLIEADNKATRGTADYDPFPGPINKYREFSATTKPALLGWDQRSSGEGKTRSMNNAALKDIRETEDIKYATNERLVVFSFTDDGPNHYLALERVFTDPADRDEKSSRPQRIWRDGQLLIVTPAGTFDLQGHRIE